MDHRDIVDYSLLFIGNILRSVLLRTEWTKHTERYYIGVKNRATESEYSIKK